MNMHDIAKKSGVSTATVSRVINNPEEVRPKTREKVEAVIREMNYVPNALAKGLIEKKTMTIGLMTVNIDNPYYAETVSYLEKDLHNLGYNIILCITGKEHRSIHKTTDTLLQRRVDGMIFIGSIYHGEEHYIESIARKVPVILINNMIRYPNVFCTICNDRIGIFEAARYCIRKNRKRLGLLRYRENTYSTEKKQKGFMEAMADMAYSGKIMVFNEESYDTEILDFLNMVKTEELDALICTDDILANIALKYLQKNGYSIPEDISIIGYNNSHIGKYSTLTLTTVDSMIREMSRDGTKLLDEAVRNDKRDGGIYFFNPSLIIEETS